ncbi:MAG: NUDIX hydrolase [Phycisphaerales bacterium]|nr:NUDIX hydrolase [Phycisphaerales bacterium]
MRVQQTAGPLCVRIDREPVELPTQHTDPVEHAWSRLQASNPRYFNGGILSFASFDVNSGTIHARAEQYKHHAVRETVDLGVTLLAVTGVLVARDQDGIERFMIGKRSPTTHRYGNLWEFGPCGGIDQPATDVQMLDQEMILQELRRECIEEAGIDLSSSSITPIALVHDDSVGSVDVVYRVHLASIPQQRANWEYLECDWLSLSELQERIGADPDQFIPTAIPIARLLDALKDEPSD